MNRSETVKELAAALCKAQATMLGAARAKEAAITNTRSYKYADLASVWDACREPLTANGLSVIQAARSIQAGVEIETLLLHSSGEWISETLAIPVQRGDAQGFGSALTYCRRYGLMAMIGIAPEDDDAEAAVNAKPQHGDFQPSQPAKITARGGARNMLTEAKQQEIDRLAGRIVDAFLAKDPDLAYAAYLDAKEALKGDADALTACWDLLDSKQRSTLKEMHKAEKDAEQAHKTAMVGSQA